MSLDEGTKLTRRQMVKALGPATATASLQPGLSSRTRAPVRGRWLRPRNRQEPCLPQREPILWGLKYDPHITKYEALGKAFTEKTGIKVVVQPQDDPFGNAGGAGRTPPDVACVMGKVWRATCRRTQS